jgi:GNAT superfamily N-acetyltransferase
VEAELRIAPFAPADEPALYDAWAAAIEEGGAFPRRPPGDLETFRAAWLEHKTAVLVARLGDRPAGSYFLRPAYPDAAAHIANAGYVVARALRRRGIGRALAEHSLAEARRHGFDAMLFTLVLEDNPSRRLWRTLSFDEVGQIPDAVDGRRAYLYWRSLR